MSKRQARIERIVGAYHEFLAASVAVDLLDERLQADPTFLSGRGMRRRVAHSLRANLETTFFIRLYAEFEAGLRDYWEDGIGQPTQPPMRDLLIAIGARRMIPQRWIDEADRVRGYRNILVHERPVPLNPIAIREARHRISRYLSRLPVDW